MTVNTEPNTPTTLDAKGRKLPGFMNDRELMETILLNQRAMMDLVNDFVENMKSNPMMKMMTGKR